MLFPRLSNRVAFVQGEVGKKEKEGAEETGGAGEGRNAYFSPRAGTVEFVCPL